MSHLCGHTALQMEAEQSHMTEMIYNLTLEIIYLLTGEKHAVVKMASIEGLLRGVYPPLSVGGGLSQMPIKKPSSHSRIPESNNQKILEVINKIMELLAGEVSGAGNSGAVEEDHLLDSLMEDHPPLTQLDGSRKRNASERFSSPPYSKDFIHEIPHHYRVSDEVTIKIIKEEEEESYMRADELLMEEHISPELSAGPTRELYNKFHHFQDENLVDFKHEEVRVTGGEQSKDEEISPHVSVGCGHARDIQEQSTKIVSNAGIQIDSDITLDFSDVAAAQLHSLRIQEKPYSCPECGRRFSEKAHLLRHVEVHTVEQPYSCSECGKSFSKKFSFIAHKRAHMGEKPYSCSECGKSFSQKAHLVRHERVHTGEKPYLCPECGKGFSQKFNFMVHKRLHTGEKPYSCLQCGKCYTHKSNLIKHEQAHTAKNPY